MYVCVQSIQLDYFNVHVGIYDNITSRYPEGHVIPILILLLVSSAVFEDIVIALASSASASSSSYKNLDIL